MRRRSTRGLTLLDVLVALGLLALLVWALRLDWRRDLPPGAAAPPPAAVAR